MPKISMGLYRNLFVVLYAASQILETGCAHKKKSNDTQAAPVGKTQSGSEIVLEGRTYSCTFKCKQMGVPENIPTSDCVSQVSFFKDRKASYHFGGVDTFEIVDYSITDDEIKLTDSNFNPPNVINFKMSSDKKTLVNSNGESWQLQ